MAEKKVSKEILDDGIQFVFATGEDVTVKVGDLSTEIQKQLLLHGLSQKLGDAYAGEDADKCHVIFQGVLTNLNEGNWTARQGGGGSPRISQLAEALAIAADESIEKCVETLATKSDEEKKTIRAHSAVQAALAEIKLRKAQADAKRLKEELGEAEPFTL